MFNWARQPFGQCLLSASLASSIEKYSGKMMKPPQDTKDADSGFF